MNLKEAFRFQNRIQGLMNEAQNILSRDQNVTETKSTYLRSKVMEGAEDAVLTDIPATDYADRITAMVEFLVWLLGEKEKLAKAIHHAKAQQEIDLDAETSLNSARQNVAAILKRMADIRSREQVLANAGYGYRFNNDGDQVTYKCDVRKVTTIHYDRNLVREKAKALHARADAVSAEIDRCIVNAAVDYVPPFDMNSGFADVLEEWQETHPV
jgi:hypothetical protein